MTGNELTSQPIRAAVIAVLRRKFEQRSLPMVTFEADDGELVDVGLLDSLDLIDVLFEVQATCGCEFDPEHLKLEGGVTVRKLVAAFSVT